jgi:hypothetical protein
VSGVPNVSIPFYVDSPYTDIMDLPYPCPGYVNSVVSLSVYSVGRAESFAVDLSSDGENLD